MKNHLKDQGNYLIRFVAVVVIFFLPVISFSQIGETVIKLRLPVERRSPSFSIKLPHIYDPMPEDFEAIKSNLTKDGFYIYRIPVSYSRYFKIGAMDIVITPTDTVYVDYVNKPYLNSGPDTTIRHFLSLNQNLTEFKLIKYIPSSKDFQDLTADQFKAKYDSIYIAGQDYIENYFKQFPYLDKYYLYYANCDLLFRIADRLIMYALFNSQDTTRKIEYPRDFFKYNDSIAIRYNKMYFSQCSYSYFNEYHIYLAFHVIRNQDFEFQLQWIDKNLKGLIRDIILGKTISQYQLRKYDKKYLPVSLKYTPKIVNNELRNTLLYRINEMKDFESSKITAYNGTTSLGKLLGSHKNKVIYIKFWATWCGPCLQQEEYLDDVDKQINNPDFKIVSICARSPKLTYDKQMASRDHFGQQIYLNDSEFNALQKEIEVPYFPYYLLINQKTNKMIKDAPNPFPDPKTGKSEYLLETIHKMMNEK